MVASDHRWFEVWRIKEKRRSRSGRRQRIRGPAIEFVEPPPQEHSRERYENQIPKKGEARGFNELQQLRRTVRPEDFQVETTARDVQATRPGLAGRHNEDHEQHEDRG